VRSRIRWSGAAIDLVGGVVVAALLVAVTPESRITQADVVRLDWLAYALLAVAGLALTVRRHWPVVAYVVAMGAAVTYLALRYPGWPVYLGAGVALIAFLSSSGRAGWPLALGGGAALAVAVGRPEGWNPLRMVAVGVAWLAIAAYTVHATELRRQRAREEARHRVVEERLRIAREMHDLISHSLATISIQSGTGLRLFRTHPQEAEAALRTIRQVSADALGLARAALDRVRDPGADGTLTAAIDDLGALLSSVRAAGLALRSTVDLGNRPVPATVGAAAYRVVQEALTNVMRHAGTDAHATVEVIHRAGVLEVEVTDSGGGGAAPARATPGHGLIGMRERVAALGGELSAGPGPAGGFRVLARLPTVRPSA
jgi:signal transduction histidine kinase